MGEPTRADEWRIARIQELEVELNRWMNDASAAWADARQAWDERDAANQEIERLRRFVKIGEALVAANRVGNPLRIELAISDWDAALEPGND